MKNALQKLTIAITGLNAVDNPGPGLAVIRALRMEFEHVRIIGLSYEALEPGIYLHDIVDKTYQISYPSAGATTLFERLLAINERENIDVVIPNFDAELHNFIKIAAKLDACGIRTYLPSHEQLAVRDKINLSDFGKTNKFDIPESMVIHQETDLAKTAEVLDYPLVIKGKFYDAFVAYNEQEAVRAFQKLNSKWGLPIIVQKFIKGTEINIAGLGNGEGECISTIPMRKLTITDKGKAWAGITLEDKSLIDLAQQFTAATKWKGGFELEVMKTAQGKLFIMEVNPRFPAWIYLTAAAGQNQPASLVKLALGEKLKTFDSYAVGKMFIRYAWDHITDVSEFQQISAFGEL